MSHGWLRNLKTPKAHIHQSKQMYYNTINTKKLQPCLVASYDIQLGNGQGLFLFWHWINLSLTYLLTYMLWYCWLGGRKSIRPVKKMGDGGGGHWLVRMEWCPARWSVCLPLLIFPCTIKSRSSLLAPAHPGGPGKKAIKWFWWLLT